MELFTKLEAFEAKIDYMNTRFEAIEMRVQNLENKIK